MKSYTHYILILIASCAGFVSAADAGSRISSSVTARITASATVINPVGILSSTSQTISLMAPPNSGLSIDINSRFLVSSLEVERPEPLTTPVRLRELNLDATTRWPVLDSSDSVVLTIIYTEN